MEDGEDGYSDLGSVLFHIYPSVITFIMGTSLVLLMFVIMKEEVCVLSSGVIHWKTSGIGLSIPFDGQTALGNGTESVNLTS